MPKILAVLLLMLGLSACSNPGSSLPPIESAAPTGYRLDSGDQLRVTVLGEPQLSGELTVDQSGAIALPTIGEVPTRGRTTEEVTTAIEQRFEQTGQLRDPQVTVQVINPRSFFILGEVARPGAYPYVYDMSVLTAVAIGGGFTYRAQTDYVSITRAVDSEVVEGRAGRNELVQPGDVIYVFERIF